MAPNPAQRARARRGQLHPVYNPPEPTIMTTRPDFPAALPPINGHIAISTKTEGRCEYCNRIWYEKGLGKCGHVHCKACPMARFQADESKAVEGQVWTVYCKMRDLMKVEVKAIDMVICPAYDLQDDIFVAPFRMLEIIVGKGDQSQTFTVHAPLLTTVSSYFTNALKTDNFTEGQTSRFNLEDEDPRIFGLLNRYLYSGYIKDANFELGQESRTEAVLAYFCRVWVLAHYFQLSVLMKHCIWCLVRSANYEGAQIFDDIEELYERAPLDSVLRRIIVDICVWGDAILFATLSDDVPVLLSRKLVIGYKRRCVNGGRSPLEDVRNYYEEEEEVVAEVEPVEEEEVKEEAVDETPSD